MKSKYLVILNISIAVILCSWMYLYFIERVDNLITAFLFSFGGIIFMFVSLIRLNEKCLSAKRDKEMIDKR